MAQQKRTQLVSVRMRVGSPASLSGLRIRHCHELGSLEEEEVRTQTHMERRRPPASPPTAHVAPTCQNPWLSCISATSFPKRLQPPPEGQPFMSPAAVEFLAAFHLGKWVLAEGQPRFSGDLHNISLAFPEIIS